jgi:hypothetical protein
MANVGLGILPSQVGQRILCGSVISRQPIAELLYGSQITIAGADTEPSLSALREILLHF